MQSAPPNLGWASGAPGAFRLWDRVTRLFQMVHIFFQSARRAGQRKGRAMVIGSSFLPVLDRTLLFLASIGTQSLNYATRGCWQYFMHALYEDDAACHTRSPRQRPGATLKLEQKPPAQRKWNSRTLSQWPKVRLEQRLCRDSECMKALRFHICARTPRMPWSLAFS